jgi:hypothetical protein
MNFWIIPLSLVCGIVLCGTAVSLFASYRAHDLLVQIDTRARAKTESNQPIQDLAPLRTRLEELYSQVRDLQSNPVVGAPSGVPRAAFNLSKRSQALRMHRRGEAPEQIAASLGLPRQEIELLLKVHRIVIQNV